jgi:hypothetical protein
LTSGVSYGGYGIRVFDPVAMVLDKPVSLLDCHLAEDFGYADSGAITGAFTASVPFTVRLELDLLI